MWFPTEIFSNKVLQTLGAPIPSCRASITLPWESSLFLKISCFCKIYMTFLDIALVNFPRNQSKLIRMVLCIFINIEEWCLINQKKRSKRLWFLVIHTTSRCCSPLISMASRLRIEHGRAGKVMSNCTFRHKQGCRFINVV